MPQAWNFTVGWVKGVDLTILILVGFGTVLSKKLDSIQVIRSVKYIIYFWEIPYNNESLVMTSKISVS